jgi:hypothetical protein
MVIYTCHPQPSHNRNYYTIIILFFQFVQYSPQTVFGDFARELCDKRRRGDADDSYKCEAAAAKGVGVSINTCLSSSSSSSFVFNRIKQCKKMLPDRVKLFNKKKLSAVNQYFQAIIRYFQFFCFCKNATRPLSQIIQQKKLSAVNQYFQAIIRYFQFFLFCYVK